MTVLELRNQIINKSVGNFYVFTGEELAIQDLYIQKIAECNNQKIIHKDTVAEVIQECQPSNLFEDNQKYCFVVRDDLDFMKSNYIKFDQSILNRNCLILLFTSADKRLKFFKVFENVAACFDFVHSDKQIKYIDFTNSLIGFVQRSGVNFENAKKLVFYCSCNFGMIKSELQKLIACSQIFNLPINNCFMNLYTNKSFLLFEVTIFSFLDSVLKKSKNLIFAQIETITSDPQKTLAFLSLLETNLKYILQAKNSHIINEKNSGISFYQLQKINQYKMVFSNREIITLLSILKKYDLAIKSGCIDSDFAIYTIILHILKSK